MALCLAICFFASLNVAYAGKLENFAKDASIEEIIEYNNTLDVKLDESLSLKAYEYNQNRIKELEKLEAQQLMALFNDGDVSILSIPTVQLGTNTNFTTANAGDNNGTKSGLSDYTSRYTLSSRSAQGKSWTFGIGSSDCFAYVGQRFKVEGTSARSADITFRGSYSGSFLGGIGGNATGEVKVKLWDATNGYWLDTRTVATQSSSNNISKPLNGNINHTVSATLRPGHTYYPYIHVVTTANQYGAPVQISRADMFDNNHGIRYDRIEIRF